MKEIPIELYSRTINAVGDKEQLEQIKKLVLKKGGTVSDDMFSGAKFSLPNSVRLEDVISTLEESIDFEYVDYDDDDGTEDFDSEYQDWKAKGYKYTPGKNTVSVSV